MGRFAITDNELWPLTIAAKLSITDGTGVLD